MTRILRRLMFLLLLVGLSAQARERVMLINAELHLDRDGRVEQLTWREQMSPALADNLRQRIDGWRFSPVLANGAPAAATLNLQLDVRIEEVGDRMRFHLQSAQTNLQTLEIDPPRFPKAQLRAGRSGYAVIRVQVDASGRVSDSESVDASHADFAKAAIQASRHWRYRPLQIAGQPAATELLIPVHFTVQGQARVPIDLSDRLGVILTGDQARLSLAQGGQLEHSDLLSAADGS